MIARLVAAVVDFAQRNAASVAFAVLALALASGWYAATHLTIDTDLEHLLPINVGWRQDERALDRAFPDNNNLLVAVIDGQTADLADTAARRLSERMRAEPQFFRYVREPDGGPFFDKNGLLFLSPAKLQKVSDELIAAQPLIGSLAHDPSLRGLFATLALFVKNADRDKGAVGRLNPMLAAIAKAIEGELGGRSAGVSWQRLMTGRKPDAGDLRHFVLSVPVLDFAAIAPGARAEAELRRLARELQIDPQHGVRLRLTGPVALDDEEFATLRQGAAASTITSVVLVCAILFAALRSARLAGAILATLAAGLSLTAGFAALAIGSLNLISIAFGVLFVGLAVDFSIQFTVCYRDQRHRQGSLSAALSGAAETIGPALLLAAGATAIGFLSFVPTNYTGIRELGWIAGFGMITAIALNFVLLPALLALVGPRGEPEPIGFRRAAPLDRFLLERRSWVLGAAVILALACAALLPRVSFDVDPLDLKNPKSEAVEVARELMKDPLETPYTAEVLAPSLAAAEALARRFDKLPEVAQVITAASFIPQDQRQKLAIIGDLTLLLGPTLSPPTTLPPPGDAEIMASIAACRAALGPLAARDGPQPGGATGRRARRGAGARSRERSAAAADAAGRPRPAPGDAARVDRRKAGDAGEPAARTARRLDRARRPRPRRGVSAGRCARPRRALPLCRGGAAGGARRDRDAGHDPGSRPADQFVLCRGRDYRGRGDRGAVARRIAAAARRAARHRAVAARRDADACDRRRDRHQAQLRQHPRAAALARDRRRVRHLFRHELARRAEPASAVEHGARHRVQRADDDSRVRQPGAVARSRHRRHGRIADAVARLHAVLHVVRPAGAAWAGPTGGARRAASAAAPQPDRAAAGRQRDGARSR